jgi:cyclopropane-fatty-acyl-phospholipid synthase
VFTHKYIFPHNRYWKYDVPNYNKDLKILKNWYLNGYHYSTTFAKWLKNLDDSQAIVKDLDYGSTMANFATSGSFT